MRIAMVAHTNAPWTPLHAAHFARRGHEICVISYHPEVLPGVRTVLMDPGRIGATPKHLYITSVPALRRALRNFAPDVVVATYLISNGLAAALAWKGPLVVSAVGTDVLGESGGHYFPGWLRKVLLRRVCTRAAAVHAVSEELAEALVALGAPAERVTCFPFGVDVQKFYPAPATTASGGASTIICTRTHDVVYGNQVIVDAVARLRAEGRDLHLKFVAGGPLLGERRRQVEKLGMSATVEFIDRVPHERIPELLRAADIYVSASARDGTSSSLLEALATGLVAVVSRIRANQGWIRDGESGFLFDVGDAADLARALGEALDRPDVRARVRAESPRLVRARGDLASNTDRLVQIAAAAI